MRSLLLLSLLVLLVPSARAEDLTGVAAFVDGDTVRVGATTVHLFGIDAPEMDQFCTDRKGKRFNCGIAAMRRLFLYIGNDPLHCVIRRRDPDGSVAATCRVKSYFKHTENGAARGELFDVALEMVLTGHALADRTQGPDYVAAEDRAREKKLGLWAGEFQPPWDWRASPRHARKAP